MPLDLPPGLSLDARGREWIANRLHEDGFAAEAAALLAPLVQAEPGRISARILRAVALADAGEGSAAIALLEDTVARVPDVAEAWSNLGMLLKVEGRFERAVEAADRAVALRPDHSQIRLNRAIVKLRAGRLDEAWADYEARQTLHPHSGLPPDRLLPDLAGLGAGAGRRVLVMHEDGFGDTLQFLRYLPLLAARGFRVLAHAPDPLARLLCDVPGVAVVLPPSSPVPEYEFHCSFLSLPRAFATRLDTIPCDVPYLAPPADRIARWAQALGDLSGLRVGLCWAGQARPWLPGFGVVDRRRSMRLADLAPLAQVPGAAFVSLQAGDPAREANDPPPGLVLHNPMRDVVDFADTAAIIASLDVVVSVDTSVVHLAGAMGKPVLLLDRYDSCWRWLADREDSPWYPTLRIVRQRKACDWQPVVARVVDILTQKNGDAHSRRQV